MACLRFVVFWLAVVSFAWAQPACPPAPWTIVSLQQLKAQQWKLDDAAARNAMAVALLPCLGDARPEMRDGIAFEAISAWLRAKQLSTDTQLAMLAQLQPQLQAKAPDGQGFAKPFAALVLSELARADRISPYLSAAERSNLVQAAVLYLQGVQDYRGLVAGEGWRHGVAHGADLLMQLALNPAVEREQLAHIVNAVQSQIAPASGHAYIFGESERLARPVLMAARRGLLDAAWWQRWMQTAAAPAPLLAWDAAFASPAGLGRLHNTKAFLLVLYANVQESKNENLLNTLLPPVREALLKLP